MMKRLFVCGDSFLTPVSKDPYKGTHFSEILAEKIGYELVPYSCGGMSNWGIGVQLNTALNSDPLPDLLIFNTTSASRLDYPITYRSTGGFPSVDDLLYDPNSKYSKISNKNATIMSRSIPKTYDSDSWIMEADPLFYRRYKVIQDYLIFLYHPELKWFVDKNLIESMIFKIIKKNIPFILIMDQLCNGAMPDNFNWLFRHNSKCYYKDSYNYISANTINGENDPGYHTSPEFQQELAELVLNNHVHYLIS